VVKKTDRQKPVIDFFNTGTKL